MNRNHDGDLGNILGLWAHPDDEAYASAGLMAVAADAGRRVVCVTATHGERGFPDTNDLSLPERKALRSRELSACLAILGVTEHHFLEYADGECNGVSDEHGTAGMAAEISAMQPDTILTFSPDGGTGHPDHIAVCRWVTLAMTHPAVTSLNRTPRLLYTTKSTEWTTQFMAGVDRSDILMAEDVEPEHIPEAEISVHYVCDETMSDRKVAALRAQTSQVEDFLQTVGIEGYKAFSRDEFFRDPLPDDPGRITRSRTLKFRESTSAGPS